MQPPTVTQGETSHHLYFLESGEGLLNKTLNVSLFPLRDPAILISILKSGSDIPSIIDISNGWGRGCHAMTVPTLNVKIRLCHLVTSGQAYGYPDQRITVGLVRVTFGGFGGAGLDPPNPVLFLIDFCREMGEVWAV
jgi:hypothetical protein